MYRAKIILCINVEQPDLDSQSTLCALTYSIILEQHNLKGKLCPKIAL